MGPDFEGGDEEIHAAVAVQILRDDIAAIFFKGDAEKPARFEKGVAALVEKKAVLFVTAVGDFATARAGELGAEIELGGGIGFRMFYESVMEPELGFVITDRLVAFEAIGNVNVGETVVVEIRRGATPGPT